MEEPSKTTSRWVFVGLIVLAANVWAQYLLWFGDQGLVRWKQTEKQLKILRKENHEAEKRNERLKEEIFLVDKETFVLEEVARRDLGLVYPDEVIFIDPGHP